MRPGKDFIELVKPVPPISEEEKPEILARALAGDLRGEEAERLTAACRNDAALLEELARHVMIERMLASGPLSDDAESFTREVLSRLRQPSAPPRRFAQAIVWRLRGRRWLPRLAVALPALAALGLGAWLILSVYWRPIAQVQRIEAVSWGKGQPAFGVGDRLRRGSVGIESGFLELRLQSGVQLILEGPARLELERPNRCFLTEGRIVARVPEAARGFILDSPRGRLVDLGTEFGVTVTRSGETEVHVLQGLVEATPAGKNATLRLRKNEALRLDTDTVRRMPSNPREFVTDLPPRDSGSTGFVHWSFDEGTGRRTINLGRNLGPPDADARFESIDGAAPGPVWTTGQFGSGIYLDGQDAYLESDFTGIAGHEPRTVAFWVKVPRDFDPRQGYGIINWGTQREPGAAWQISVNPEAREGPLGRLRVGVHQAPVIGVTDLRDDRWHHCAAVMYGGHRPDVSTHVLLYIDGQLEPAANKAVAEIRTDTDSQAAHGIWLGRNIAFRTVSSNEPRRFFRGCLDEVFIFDRALSQKEIQELMRANTVSSPLF